MLSVYISRGVTLTFENKGSSRSAAWRFAAPLHITCWQMVNHRGFTKDLIPFVHCPEELSEKYLICWLSVDKKTKKKCHLKYWRGNGYGETEDIQPQMSQKNTLLYSHHLWSMTVEIFANHASTWTRKNVNFSAGCFSPSCSAWYFSVRQFA